IEISVRTSRIDPEVAVEFVVRDTGIGMSSEQLGRVFDPYRQADVRTQLQFGGTGLGLAISRELARRMGGDVVATSVLGHGSEFRFTITGPRASSNDVAHPEPESVADLAGTRVLLVEDQLDVAVVVKLHLEIVGC